MSPNKKSCSNCGESFSCGLMTGTGISEVESCWCEGLPRVEIVAGRDCFCPKCLARIVDEQKTKPSSSKPPVLVEGVDYYLEGNALVFTASYHLRRGYCCENGCRHCPYENLTEVRSV